MNIVKLAKLFTQAGSLLLLALMTLLVPISAQASMTINQLEREGGVEITSWLSKGDNASEPAAIREQVILYIEVATPRWFTGGTRISGFGMPDLIVKQRNQLATNYTERKDGQTWSRQRWEITLYPQQSGEYRLPKVPVRVQVSALDGSNVSGTLYTEPMSLFTYLPDASFTHDEAWFSANDVKVQESWSASSEELHAGDSIVRTLEVEADDTLSIMLPPLGDDSIAGVKAYPKPSVLLDSQTRGVYKSKRVDEVTYIVTTGGEVVFPEQVIRWWDVETQSVQVMTLEAKKVRVAHTWRSLFNTYKTEFVILSIIILALLIASRLIYRFFKTHPTPPWWELAQSIRHRDWPSVRRLIYRKGLQVSGEVELKKMRSDASWQQTSQEVQDDRLDATQSRWMWRQLKDSKRGCLKHGSPESSASRKSESQFILKGLDRWRKPS
ncbi:BatD family protein [Vibrio variabilis]|uniref:BatD family protein n=1 Tax=Vibrio variabilis TaxID=990271 RepID=UPI000DD7F242|nr:BatD family protein [Vibrio variabilis]